MAVDSQTLECPASSRIHSTIQQRPSVLLAVCESIANQTLQPALAIGMPIGFSHAPAAKRKLMQSKVPFVTVEGTLGGGLLVAVALNAIAESLIEKPNCHCYLG